MLGFILFSAFQILQMIFAPRIATDWLPSFDGEPYFSAIRLIGLKEIGLMVIYSTSVFSNDEQFMYATVLGRATVLPFSLTMIIYFGAPFLFFASVMQDILGLTWTFWALR
jgi:hypothetical protein